jgi:hypothetical protein
MSRQVLIGYHKSDSESVRRLYDDLIKRGITVWIDTRNIKGGQNKRQAIYNGIVSSDCFIACLSPQFLQDEFCRTQIFLARAFDKQILPVLVSVFSHRPLGDILEAGQKYTHAIKGIEDLYILDFSGYYEVWGEGSYEKNFGKLVDAIKPVPKPAPVNSEILYVSYNWNDTDFANRLARDLLLARGRVWIDKLSIQSGGNWREAMYDGLRTSHRFIICLSPEAASSENVKHEVLIARMRDLPIFPVISERIHRDQSLMFKLKTVLSESEEMRFLNDLEWFIPEPDYQTLLTHLKETVGLTESAGLRKQGIFISYRRADSQAITGRVHEKLVEKFGAETVFMDVDTIPKGKDFSEYYKGWLKDRAAIMLVIIGKKWATMKSKADEQELPRIHQEDDHVRIEVATALAITDLTIIPVLVEGADMPKPEDLPESLHRLTRLNGAAVRHDPDFGSDIKKLLMAIEKSQQT